MRAIIHVGTYKTGTSSFQNRLHFNRDAALRQGVLYPETGLAKRQRYGVRHMHLVYDHVKKGGPVLPNDFRNEINRSDCETVILSAEAWSNSTHLSHLTRFACALKDIGFTEIDCVAVFRNISDYAQRLYREFTINQGNRLEYLRYTQKEAGSLDYLFLANTLRAISGERAHFINYDEQDDITDAILEAVSLKETLSLPRVERQNIAAGGALLAEFARLANRRGIGNRARSIAYKRFRSEHPDLAKATWTERVANDLTNTSRSYLTSFVHTTGMEMAEAERLLTPKPIGDRHVSDVTKRARKLLVKSAATLQVSES